MTEPLTGEQLAFIERMRKNLATMGESKHLAGPHPVWLDIVDALTAERDEYKAALSELHDELWPNCTKESHHP